MFLITVFSLCKWADQEAGRSYRQSVPHSFQYHRSYFLKIGQEILIIYTAGKSLTRSELTLTSLLFQFGIRVYASMRATTEISASHFYVDFDLCDPNYVKTEKKTSLYTLRVNDSIWICMVSVMHKIFFVNFPYLDTVWYNDWCIFDLTYVIKYTCNSLVTKSGVFCFWVWKY